CRWTGAGAVLDVMPSGPGILSFDNRWYSLAARTAGVVRLPGGPVIRLIAAPAFLATKLEALKDRGKGDYLFSHDLEDIVTVVDGRPSIVEEMNAAEPD